MKGMVINMLCFLFAGLIVALDQFFKRWILLTLDLFEPGPEIIPGVLALTHIENPGAFAGMLAGQRWLLAGIAVVAAFVLIMILLRYNEGFWGTLGLAAVLGGTVGNLVDRVLYGHVIDMFRTLFIDFWIFNIADIFITMGFLTFCIHFISMSIRVGKETAGEADADPEDSHKGEGLYEDEYGEPDYDPDSYRDMPAAPEMRPAGPVHTDFISKSMYPSDTPAPKSHVYFDSAQGSLPDYEQEPETQVYFEEEMESVPEPVADVSPTLDALDALESELGSIVDQDIDDMLREYGFEDD